MTRTEQDQVLFDMDKLENEIMFYKAKQATDGLTQSEWWHLQDAKNQLKKLRNL